MSLWAFLAGRRPGRPFPRHSRRGLTLFPWSPALGEGSVFHWWRLGAASLSLNQGISLFRCLVKASPPPGRQRARELVTRNPEAPGRGSDVTLPEIRRREV